MSAAVQQHQEEEEQVQQQQVPILSTTVIRIRRKRGAPPSSDWVVASKKTRAEGEEEQQKVFKLAATADKPSISAISNVIPPSQVAVVEYDLVNGVINKPQIVDQHQEQLNEALDMVEKMDFTEGKDKNEAPLASNESLDDDQYVYDFYAPSQSTFLNFNDDLEIRHITDEERQLMFVDDGGSDEDSINADDDQDSNDENDYRNDYPDEGEFDYENDTTSSDDYDHYGDEDENYNDYLDGGEDGEEY